MTVFRKSKNLSEVNEASKKYRGSPQASLFRSAYKELAYLTKSNPNPTLSPENMETINRALIKASNREVAKMEKMMTFLATTGSVTPFIGLFGTVWGIMDSFQQIGVSGSTNLATVAPGISEALIATAFGLVAAIPAVIAYNYYLSKINMISSEMENFSSEFLNIIESFISRQ